MGHWVEQHPAQAINGIFPMDVVGRINAYDSRTSNPAAVLRTVVTPQYVQTQSYPGAPTHALGAAPHHMPHEQFNFHPYPIPPPNPPMPAFTNNFRQQHQRPVHLPTRMGSNDSRRVSYPRGDGGQVYVEEQPASIPMKMETQWKNPPRPPVRRVNVEPEAIARLPPRNTTDVNFNTEVDTLMRTIQAKAQMPQKSSPIVQTSAEDGQDDTIAATAAKKRYQCTVPGCSKCFFQKTHLDIHVRAHTGYKPYQCKEPGCDRSFTQLGNLKTHERRHTGEKPFECEICHKRFAQRGNVRAHQIVHDTAKPYICRLDECGKPFTQLGNLKSHQNKFHSATIRELTARFACIEDGDLVDAADKQLWEYFADLYKNSNKGIKGRGKDRKVGPKSKSSTNTSRSEAPGTVQETTRVNRHGNTVNESDRPQKGRS